MLLLLLQARQLPAHPSAAAAAAAAAVAAAIVPWRTKPTSCSQGVMILILSSLVRVKLQAAVMPMMM
jgi:hypothetical protein